jgi:cell filamentation protein
MSSRYTVHPDEDYEPGSNNQVLKNYLQIKSTEAIESLEAQELKRSELEIIRLFGKEHRFTAEDICNIHELWLGDIYPCAGRYRTVNMGKDDFFFAPSARIPDLMDKFEKDYLNRYTPCLLTDTSELAYALSVVHIELILIHPFREGNGRLARLLADFMTWQAKDTLLDFNEINQTINSDGFRRYILAIHAGLAGDYLPMKIIFRKILEDSI